MLAHDSVIPESPQAIPEDGSSRQMSKQMEGDGGLRIWFAHRLHRIEECGEASVSCPLWFYRRPPHACHSSICSFIFLIMAYSLFLHASAVHELSVSYGPADQWKEIVIDDRLAGVSLVSYELPATFFANSRHFIESRPSVFNGVLQQYSCSGATQRSDAELRRGSGDPAFHQLIQGLDHFTPCGLVSMSVFTDQFRLTETLSGVVVPLDESNLAWSSDSDIYKDWIVETSGSEHLEVEGIRSWVPDRTFFEHLMVWYRTPASPSLRNLWARIPGGLPAGSYNLSFPVNSPIWPEWGLESKRVVFSQASTFSQLGSPGASFCLAAVCCVVAGVDFLAALVLLIAAPRKARKAAVHPE